MRLRRRPTRSLFGWLTVLLVFMQIATAAYACPAAVAVSQVAVTMAEMPGCSGSVHDSMDPDQPQLCRAHCQQGSQAVHATPTPDAPVAPVLLAVLDWTHTALMPTQPAGRTMLVTSGAPPPGSPPLYLSLLVLRN